MQALADHFDEQARKLDLTDQTSSAEELPGTQKAAE
jgi:hypothetical protein